MHRFLISASLILFVASSGYSMPAANDKNTPYISKGGSITGREGSRVELGCETKEYGDYIKLWSFSHGNVSKTLFAGEHSVQGMKGVRINKATGGIEIDSLNESLVGEYLCKLSDPKLSSYVVYKLAVQSAPKIVPSPQKGKINVRKNDQVAIKCAVESNTPFTVQWTHQSKVIEENSQTLEIPRATAVHEGKYTCIARNEVGERTFSFDVEIDYEPEIKLSEKIIHGPVGDNVEVRCEAKAHPKAEISWYFANNEPVLNSRKYKISNFDKYSILRISSVDLKDYGEYYCEAKNPVKNVHEYFEITGRPSKPKFDSASSGTDSDTYLIRWSVFSQSPIIDYNMKIREIDHSTGERGNWRHVSVTPKNEDNGSIRHETYMIDNLSEFNSYEVELEVKNEHGTTKSDIFKFATTRANSCSSLNTSILTIALFALLANIFN